jgi:hypothetical protein
VTQGPLSVTGQVEHPQGETQTPSGTDQQPRLETLSDDELEVELTIAAYAPGRLRWERYQRLLRERLRRRPIVA